MEICHGVGSGCNLRVDYPLKLGESPALGMSGKESKRWKERYEMKEAENRRLKATIESLTQTI